MSFFSMIERPTNNLDPFFATGSIATKPPTAPAKKVNTSKGIKPLVDNNDLEINVNYIVTKKPPINQLRKYMSTQINSIRSEESLLFE